jgi:hypothetical protein
MFFYLSLLVLSHLLHGYCLVIARLGTSRGNLFSFRHCESRKARGKFLLFVIARLLSRGNLLQSALIMRSPRSQMLARDDGLSFSLSSLSSLSSLPPRHCESRKARGNLLRNALIMRSPRSLMLARDDKVTKGQSDDAEKTLFVIAKHKKAYPA